jgi:hypothetical protein
MTGRLFAYDLPVAQSLMTLNGLVLVHDNEHEMGFLLSGGRVVDLPPWVKPEEQLRLANHPQLSSVRFPLDRKDFRDAS